LGIWPQTVGKWRGRFVRGRLQGPVRPAAAGRPRTITDDRVEQVITKTLEAATTPGHALVDPVDGQAGGAEPDAVSRIWRAFALKPHLVEAWKLSTDPQLIDKLGDIVWLYLGPPEATGSACLARRRGSRPPSRRAGRPAGG
jgi:hypothetical protein